MIFALRDHIPIKQGLRHTPTNEFPSFEGLLRDHIPIKQGLRLGHGDTLQLAIFSETIFQ